MTADRRCVFCGRGPVDLHHWTGRYSPPAEYFDGGLVVALCRRCHAREHAVLRRLGLEWPRLCDDPTVYLRHRLGRFVATSGRIAEHGRPLVLDPSSTQALCALLSEVVDALEVETESVR